MPIDDSFQGLRTGEFAVAKGELSVSWDPVSHASDVGIARDIYTPGMKVADDTSMAWEMLPGYYIGLTKDPDVPAKVDPTEEELRLKAELEAMAAEMKALEASILLTPDPIWMPGEGAELLMYADGVGNVSPGTEEMPVAIAALIALLRTMLMNFGRAALLAAATYVLGTIIGGADKKAMYLRGRLVGVMSYEDEDLEATARGHGWNRPRFVPTGGSQKLEFGG